LTRRDIIVTDASLSGGTLFLRRGRQRTEVPVRPKLTTNNAQVLVDALKAGKGVGTTQVLLVADELKSGALVRVLPEYEIEPTEFFLVYPSSKFLRPIVRAFVDFAAPALQRIEGVY
jgi:DNA-binding transcriptional LysR family regulator